jgi:hypothetical protein
MNRRRMAFSLEDGILKRKLGKSSFFYFHNFVLEEKRE